MLSFGEPKHQWYNNCNLATMRHFVETLVDSHRGYPKSVMFILARIYIVGEFVEWPDFSLN